MLFAFVRRILDGPLEKAPFPGTCQAVSDAAKGDKETERTLRGVVLFGCGERCQEVSGGSG